jgi:AcrR family transcriptional regulator
MYQNEPAALSQSRATVPVMPRTTTQSTPPARRGRPAAATREQVLAAALHRYLRGRRVDVQAIAAELGLGRATIYRWFGSREELLGEAIVLATEPVLAAARRGTRGKGGQGLLDTFDRFNRSLADAPALRSFVEQERDAALRVLTSGAGIVQPRIVEMICNLIEEEAEAGTYDPPVESQTLGYAIVRLAEAFLFNDAIAGIRGDVDRLRDLEAALLGVKAGA